MKTYSQAGNLQGKKSQKWFSNIILISHQSHANMLNGEKKIYITKIEHVYSFSAVLIEWTILDMQQILES